MKTASCRVRLEDQPRAFTTTRTDAWASPLNRRQLRRHGRRQVLAFGLQPAGGERGGGCAVHQNAAGSRDDRRGSNHPLEDGLSRQLPAAGADHGAKLGLRARRGRAVDATACSGLAMAGGGRGQDPGTVAPAAAALGSRPTGRCPSGACTLMLALAWLLVLGLGSWRGPWHGDHRLRAIASAPEGSRDRSQGRSGSLEDSPRCRRSVRRHLSRLRRDCGQPASPRTWRRLCSRCSDPRPRRGSRGCEPSRAGDPKRRDCADPLFGGDSSTEMRWLRP